MKRSDAGKTETAPRDLFVLAENISLSLPRYDAETIVEFYYGLRSLLTASFKLRQKERYVDYWEIVLVEISFFFDSPFVVARVAERREHEEISYFLRTNVTAEEYELLLGETIAAKLGPRAPLFPGLIDELKAFFALHASKRHESTGCFHSIGPDPMVSWEKYREHVGLLQSSIDQGFKDECYSKCLPKNPLLYRLCRVGTFPLFGGATLDERVFLGTIEVFLNSSFGCADGSVLFEQFGRLISLAVADISVSENAPDDWTECRECTTIPIDDMPTFDGYPLDLDRQIDSALQRQEVSHAADESTLPVAFDDLYRQLGSYLGQDQVSIGFVVADRPVPGHEPVGRYYFPATFVHDLVSGADLKETSVVIASLTALSRTRPGGGLGVPLRKGLLGYLAETFFPTFALELDEDARVHSYRSEQFAEEKTVFFPHGEASLGVMEIPLVLFADNTVVKSEQRVYPTSVVLFFRSDDGSRSPSRLLATRHRLYALAYQARYLLAQAFAAEVLREEQLKQTKRAAEAEFWEVVSNAITHAQKYPLQRLEFLAEDIKSFDSQLGLKVERYARDAMTFCYLTQLVSDDRYREQQIVLASVDDQSPTAIFSRELIEGTLIDLREFVKEGGVPDPEARLVAPTLKLLPVEWSIPASAVGWPDGERKIVTAPMVRAAVRAMLEEIMLNAIKYAADRSSIGVVLAASTDTIQVLVGNRPRDGKVVDDSLLIAQKRREDWDKPGGGQRTRGGIVLCYRCANRLGWSLEPTNMGVPRTVRLHSAILEFQQEHCLESWWVIEAPWRE